MQLPYTPRGATADARRALGRIGHSPRYPSVEGLFDEDQPPALFDLEEAPRG